MANRKRVEKIEGAAGKKEVLVYEEDTKDVLLSMERTITALPEFAPPMLIEFAKRLRKALALSEKAKGDGTTLFDQYHIEKYGWRSQYGVYKERELVCVCTYKKGAVAVCDELNRLAKRKSI